MLQAATVLSGLLACAVLALYLSVSWDLPSVDLLRTEEGLRSLIPHDGPPPQVVLLPLHEMPPQVINAFIAAIDPDLAGKKWTGRNRFARGLSRKLLSARRTTYGHAQRAVQELNIALSLNREEMLGAWLAVAYFGKNTYGISAAVEKYYDKPLRELTLCEAAVLASIPNAPIDNPIDHPDRAQKRQQFVLGEMIRLGLASETDLESCKQGL